MDILFITTHNLATNPRLVKEIRLAIAEGYKAGVVIFHYSNWSEIFNRQLLEELKDKLEIHVIPAVRKPFLPWLYSSLLHSSGKLLLKTFSKSKFLLSVFAEKRSFLLIKKLRNINVKPKLIIAHNIGAFYPTFLFAKENKIPFAVDIEDYHAGESSNSNKISFVKKLCKIVYVDAAYLSAASPLILEYSLKDLGSYINSAFVVNNYFLSTDFIEPKNLATDKMKLIWFSQNIDKGRGLELLVPAIESLNEILELHLYGNLNEDFYHKHLKGIKNIFIHPPLAQINLHKELANYDIGLAIEPDKDLNNSLAVSNKINAYMQAGLYIIASNTLAQVKWLKEFSSFGVNVQLENDKEVQNILLHCFENISSIREKATARFATAKDYCWEQESKKLSEAWRNILKQPNAIAFKKVQSVPA